MSDFIELTSPFDSNRRVFVKVSSVSCIEILASHTEVSVEAGSISVKESPQEVIEKIEEWKKVNEQEAMRRENKNIDARAKLVPLFFGSELDSRCVKCGLVVMGGHICP